MDKESKVSYFDIFVIFCLVGVVPFLLYFIGYEMPVIDEYGNPWVHNDYFNLIKVRVIKIVAVLIFLQASLNFLATLKSFFIIDKIKENFNKIYLFTVFILISLIISFLISDFKGIVTFGAMQRFESIWVHFSYIIIFFYSISFFKKSGSLKVFTYAVILSTFVVGLVGTLQYFNNDILQTEFIRRITAPEGSSFNVKSLGSYTTMYNTNTSASYSVLMMFLLMTLFFINEKKHIKGFIVINMFLIGITFYNSFSKASYIALFAGVSTVILLNIVLLFVKRKYKAFALLTSTCVIISITLISILLTNDKVMNMVKGILGPEALFTDWEQVENELYFYNKDDNYIKVVLEDNGFKIYEEDKLLLEDLYKEVEEYTLNTINFEDLYIKNFIYESNMEGSSENYIDFNDYFYIVSSSEPYILSKYDLRQAEYVKFIGFEGYGNLFTNRGYIWSRSLAMLVEQPFGYGSDVFYFKFPNDTDVVGRAFYNQPKSVHIDKPHSIYLNMAINNGFLYLIGFIGIVTTLFLEKLKLMIKNYNNINNKALILYLSGIVAYLVNGLSTDNIVVIIMLFWIYLAIGSNQFMLKKESN